MLWPQPVDAHNGGLADRAEDAVVDHDVPSQAATVRPPPSPGTSAGVSHPTMRLQKLLASAGLGSRRSVEDWIRAGRVTVGGRVARLGDQASAADDVRLDGVRLELQLGHTLGTLQVLLYYKPAGEVTTRRDPEGRPTVFERLPQPKAGRWINVGRLDVNTSGLLLFTTDGELAHRLMHPSSAVEREYLVRLRGEPGPAVLRQLQEGVRLADGPARFDLIVADRAEHTDRAGRGGELRGARAGAGAGRARGGSHSSFRVVLRRGSQPGGSPDVRGSGVRSEPASSHPLRPDRAAARSQARRRAACVARGGRAAAARGCA